MAQSQSIPFGAEVRIPGIGEFQLNICIRGDSSEGELEIAQDVINQFVSASAAGMFSGPNVHPTQSTMVIASSDVKTPGKISYVCNVKSVDLGAYRILLNMAVQCHHLHERLREFQLTSCSDAKTFHSLHEVVKREFPRRFAKMPFALNIDKNLSKSKRPVVRMEFGRKLEEIEFQRLSEWITVWETLLITGGYLDTFAPLEDLVFHPGELYMVAPRVIENTISEFRCSISAFDSLINMAVKVHVALCPIEKLEIA